MSRRYPDRRITYRIVRSGKSCCSQCGTVLDEQGCITCLTRAALAETPRRTQRWRVSVPRLKGPGLIVRDLETGEEKYRVDQKTATNKARETVATGVRSEWSGRPTRT